MNVRLLLDIPHDLLDEAGYAVHHQARDLWPAYAKSGVALEPNTGMAMLEPFYQARAVSKGEWQADEGTQFNEQGPYTGWEYKMLKIGGVSSEPPYEGHGGVTTSYSLMKGEGRYFSFYIWSPVVMPSYADPCRLDLFFGGRYRLELPSQGIAVLYRSPTPTWQSGYVGYTGLSDWVPVARGPMLGRGETYAYGFWGTLLQILPLPGALRVSTGDAAIFYRESDLDPATGNAMLPAPIRLFTNRMDVYWTDSPVQFSSSGSLVSPAQALSYPSSQAPSVSCLAFQPLPEGTSLSISLTKGDGSPPDPPLEDYRYAVTLATANPSRSPFYWAAEIEFAPTQKTVTGASVPVDAFIREIQERSSLDSPLRSLTFVASNKGGLFDSYKSRANLPVQLQIGGAPRFTGVTYLPTSQEGLEEWVTLECYDGWRRLQNAFLFEPETYDGMVHTDVVRRICHRAGLPDSRLDIASDTFALPSSQNDDPLYQPAPGQSVASFLEYIRDSFSGWRMGFDEQGNFFYRPPSSDLTPLAHFHRTTTEANSHGGAAAKHYPLFNLTQRVDQSQHRNVIRVTGQAQDDDERPSAEFIDYSSLYDPTYAYYVGERRPMTWDDPSLNNQDAVNWVCRTLAEKYARFRIYQTFEAQFDPTLKPESVIVVDGQIARIASMTTTFTTKEQRTHYEVEAL